jgi:hypothetical protein
MRNNRRLWMKRCKESFGLMLIGDGVLALLEPERHVRLWAEGPRLWRMLMKPFVSRPTITRVVGGLELAFGLWLSSRQDVPTSKKWKFW